MESCFNKEKLIKVSNWIQNCIDNDRFKGASIAVLTRNDGIIYESYHGYSRNDVLMDKNAVFRIYSMTKPIVSIGLMMLYECDGKFKLNDPVKMYIHEFDKKLMPGVLKMSSIDRKDVRIGNYECIPIKHDIKIWHLLTHTAGLTYGFDKNGILNPLDKLYNDNKCVPSIGKNNITLKEWVAYLAKMPINFEPGTRMNYSYATDVVGRLIEVLSGQTLDVYLQERIFKPLGMDNTGFKINDDNKRKIADIYMPNEYRIIGTTKMGKILKHSNAKLVNITRQINVGYTDKYKFLSGGGGLLSTLYDYCKFCKMLLHGGYPLIGTKTLEFMTMNQLPSNSDAKSIVYNQGYTEIAQKGVGFGLGFSVQLGNDNETGMRVSDGFGQYCTPMTFSKYFMLY